MHGTGKLIFEEEDDRKDFLSELSNNDMVHGEVIFKEGAKYIGGFKKGKMSGKGTLKTSKQEIYGDFEDGKLNGHAFIKYLDKESAHTIKGQFLQGKRNGFGIDIFNNGFSIYSEFKDDLRNGLTVEIFSKNHCAEESKIQLEYDEQVIFSNSIDDLSDFPPIKIFKNLSKLVKLDYSVSSSAIKYEVEYRNDMTVFTV